MDPGSSGEIGKRPTADRRLLSSWSVLLRRSHIRTRPIPALAHRYFESCERVEEYGKRNNAHRMMTDYIGDGVIRPQPGSSMSKITVAGMSNHYSMDLG